MNHIDKTGRLYRSSLELHISPGAGRGKRTDANGSGNLGMKEVEFKLDIGKRRLPSPDVKRTSVEKERAPEFVIKPRRQFVDEGQNAKFKVAFEGSANTRLSWTRNGKPVDPSKKFKMYEDRGYHYLEVFDVHKEDSGMYIGTINNSAGTNTAAAELDVFEKPKLLTRGSPPPTLSLPLQDVDVVIGDRDVKLKCEVTGDDRCTITWLHNGCEVRPGRQHRCLFNGRTASLTLMEVGEDDGGEYQCVIKNNNGEVSTSCTVSTQEGEKLEPPVFIKELQDMEVEDGDKVELIVEVKGSQPVHVYWMHNNRQLTVDTPGLVLRAVDGVHSLSIPRANAESGGEYVCEAYNDYGDTDTFCRLNVKEVDKSQPPEFLTRPKPLNVTEGSSAATFTCRVQGHPPPTVSWECNGCPLSTNERCKVSQEGDRHSLEILGPRSVDSGQYVCQVHNSAGRISHTCSLTLTPASSTTPGAASVPAGPLDFRAVLKPRPSSGQLRPQRSLDWDRPDKENHVTDFRHVLLKNRKNSLPLSTTSNTTSTTSTATSGSSRRMVPTGLSTSSSASSVSGSASGRVGGVRKNLKLFEKQATASTDRSTVTSQRSSAVTSQRSSAVTSRRSASPDHQPLPHRTGLTSRDSPCPDTGPSPVRDVKDSAVRDRRREDRVADSVLTQSTVHTSLAAPTTSRERSRERMARHPKIAAAHTTFSKSLDRSHWRGAEPTDTDFRSVFSKPQAATDRSKVSTDSKPSWARPNSSREQRRNGHSKDVKQTTSGKVDFRSVLKPRQSEDSGQSSSMSRDGKPTVQSSQSATDFRAVLSKPKHGGDDRKPAPSKPAQSRVAAGRSPMNKSLPSKGLHSVRSKFETSAQDSNSVQSKAPRPLTTTTTTTKNVMVSGQSGTATSESTSTSRWKDGGGQDRLALKEEDNTTEDISSGKERRRDRIPAKVENTSEDISDSSATANWKERRRDRIPAKVENTSEDISDSSATANWKERRRDRIPAKVENTSEDISDSSATANWKERRRDRIPAKVENTSENISDSSATATWKERRRDRIPAKVENTSENISDSSATANWKERRRDRIPAKVENTSENISDSSATANWKERRRDRIPAKVENTSENISDSSATANWKERRRDRMAAKVLDDTTEDISDSSATANWKERRRERLAQKVENMSEDISDSSTSSSCQERLAAKVLDTTVEDKAPDIMATLSDVSRYTDDLKCSDSSQLSDSAISSTLSKLSELSDLSDSSSAISEVEAQEPPGRRRLARLKGRLGGGGGEDSEREAPSIVERLEDRSVTSGSQVLMQCRVSGVPLPTISWTHNNNTIKPSRFFQLSYQENLAKLLVAEAFSEDEGEYTCTVTNSAGTDSCSCYLAVKVSSSRSSRSGSHMFEGAVSTPPRVGSLTPASQTVRRGQPVTFQMTFSGIPSPVVTWYLGKTALQTGGGMTITTEPGSSTLTIPSTEANNSGRYTVTLTNDLGSDEMSATLSVEDVPECPVGMPHVYDISSTSVSLSWCGPAYDGGSVITHYVIEVKDTHSNQWSTLTDDCQSTSYHALTLKPDTFYQFRVRASNRLGLSEPSLPTSSVAMTDPLQTSVDYESDDELPFEPKEVTLTPGRKFEDHYEYLHEVGRGKFGSVYKCRDKQTGKIWAAKVLKVREKEKAVVRGEVEVMNRLAHPKLLMLWDAFEAPRTMVLVMEFVGAGELFERVIREDFVLTERDCVHFVRQICIGVGYMHSKSILHLDLKPENVLCVAENSNQIKIIDFGLARFYKPGDSLQVLFGTPEFIAPEVINYDSISFATDMWSIGVICYILLTGLSPFLGDNDAETLANVTSGEYDFDDDSFEDISDRAKDFINRLLIKQQEKRQTITECEKHTWLSEEDERIRCKRLNTDRLRTFMARRKWQKTGNAIRALGRMASLQKLLLGGSTSSSGSLSSNPDAHSAAPCAVSTPVFSPPVHQPSSAHPLSSAAVREVEEKRGEAATTSTTSRKGGDCEKGDSSSAAESDSDCRKSATAATDRKSSPPSWRKAKREGAAKDAESTNPSGRSKPTQQDALCDITQTAPPDEPASATTTKTTTKRQTDRASPRRTPAEPEDGSPCPPRFVKEMVDCRAFRDDAVRFDVTVTGRPPPHVEWLMEEEVVAVDERHCVEQGEGGHWSLIVRHVDEDDDGEYQCRAVNSQGEACCSADLSVYSLGAI